ncbi:MAG: hypothetical protein H6733_09150 [Alphaproteobacteria bacterium]|nr:hypothetical protein [Alphaproteobacteria bacterium]
MKTEKLNPPFVVLRVDVDEFRPEVPGWAITVLSVFDTESSAMGEVERLNTLNGDKGCVYLYQRAKKDFRGASVSDAGGIAPQAAAERDQAT